MDQLVALLKAARAPLIVAGGGVHYSGAEKLLAKFAAGSHIPVAETQAGKGCLPWDHPFNLGAIGVTGTSAANAAAARADLVIGIGTRLQDFTTGSRALFTAPNRSLVQINVAAYDAGKHEAAAVVGDAGAVLAELIERLGSWRSGTDEAITKADVARWNSAWHEVTAAPASGLPSDAQVIGALWRNSSANAVVVCAAGGLPGELHKLWLSRRPDDYHVEYGYSCMGYEIAGGLGVKMAQPHRDVYVLVGDGSYLMLNSELATSIALGYKLLVIVVNNRGFGCINRLQKSTGGAAFKTMWTDSQTARRAGHRFRGARTQPRCRRRKSRFNSGLGAGAGTRRAIRPHACDRDRYRSCHCDRAGRCVVGCCHTRSIFPRRGRCGEGRLLGPAQAPSAGRLAEMSVRFGVSPIAWINDDLPALGGDTPLETVLADAQELGFSGIELGGKFPREPHVLEAMLSKHRLALVGGWYSASLLTRSAEAEIEALQSHLALLKAMGSGVFIVAETSNAIHGDQARPLSATPRLADSDWKQFGRKLTEVADHLARAGLRMAYHHHLGTVVESQHDLERFLESTGPSVGLTVDTGHAALGGVDTLVAHSRESGARRARALQGHPLDGVSAVAFRKRQFFERRAEGYVYRARRRRLGFRRRDAGARASGL